MPNHGLILYFKLKRLPRLEILTSVINTIITRDKTPSLTGGGRGFSSKLLFLEVFVSFWAKSMIWHYKRYFNCNSKNIIQILMCNTCKWLYLGQTTNLKQRIRKHKSDVFHPQNSFCKKCVEHLRDCSRMKNLSLEYSHFYIRIKKNYASLKKNVSL